MDEQINMIVGFPQDILLVLTIGSIVVAIAAVLYAINVNRKSKKTMDRINDMLDEATEGHFQAKDFSEEEISALESRFADFLAASLATEDQMAQEKNRIKTMISDISHQTKTPIANLLLYSELLGEDENLSQEGKASVELIHGQTEKLRFLVDSLVKLSRLENGIVMLSTQKASLKEVVDAVVEELSPKAAAKGLKLCGPVEECVDLEAHFDPKWTQEALVNIVDNAIKYTDRGSVEIAFSATDMFARIDIRDTGIGIREEDYAKIFQRFYRSSDVAQEEGVGIGLYLAREIVTEEGGYIRLKSKVGEGSIFSIFLPIGMQDKE